MGEVEKTVTMVAPDGSAIVVAGDGATGDDVFAPLTVSAACLLGYVLSSDPEGAEVGAPETDGD